MTEPIDQLAYRQRVRRAWFREQREADNAETDDLDRMWRHYAAMWAHLDEFIETGLRWWRERGRAIDDEEEARAAGLTPGDEEGGPTHGGA